MKPNNSIVCQHLYQLYPNIPKYVNDPQQSDIIAIYDSLLKRFQGIYGREPLYFVRSPATCALFGSVNQPVNMSNASFCSLQNVIICVAPNGHQQIRFNHYQTAVYGEKILQNQQSKWKYQSQNDDYTNILVASLKTYAEMTNISSIPGLDVLVFDDFVKEEHLNWSEAMCLGILYAVHSASRPITQMSALTSQFTTKYIKNLKKTVPQLKQINYSLIGQYSKISISQNKQQAQLKYLQFPKQTEIIIAHSMTPMPKKMIKGKRQNLRICQIYIGIQIIKNQLGFNSSIADLSILFSYVDQLKKQLNCTTKELLDTLHDYVPNEDLTHDRIQQLTDKSLIQILKNVPFANNVIDQNLIFKPYKRIKFCLEEQLDIQNLRTENFVETIQKNYERGKELLEIGSEQIDQMVNLIKDLATGYKILGDGWGGYLIIMSHPTKTKRIVDTLVSDFYMSAKNKMLLSDDVEQYIKIVGKPATNLLVLDPASQIWYC